MERCPKRPLHARNTTQEREFCSWLSQETSVLSFYRSLISSIKATLSLFNIVPLKCIACDDSIISVITNDSAVIISLSV